MRWHSMLMGVLPATLLLATPAEATVTVTFVDPAYFTDAADTTGNSFRTLLAIKRHLEHLGDVYLQPADTLKIEVLDIRLAGRMRTMRTSQSDVRVATGDADWPRIEVRYALESGAGTSKPVRETIVDMAYLRRIYDNRYLTDALPHEKRMLEEWFRARFVEHKPPG